LLLYLAAPLATNVIETSVKTSMPIPHHQLQITDIQYVELQELILVSQPRRDEKSHSLIWHRNTE